jgi:hypothetical protein
MTTSITALNLEEGEAVTMTTRITMTLYGGGYKRWTE